jgi:hypothetical protein
MAGARRGKAWRRLARRWGADTRASAAIEAAVTAPLLLMFVIGAAEFGNMLYNANLVQTGVRDAARYLARVSDPVAAEPLARNLAITGSITGETPPRVPWWSSEDIVITHRVTDNPPDPQTGHRAFRSGPQVRVIRVSTTIDYAGLGTLGVLGQDAVTIAFAHEERFVGE